MAIGICGHSGAKSEGQNCPRCTKKRGPKVWEGTLSPREQSIYRTAFMRGDRNGYQRAYEEMAAHE